MFLSVSEMIITDSKELLVSIINSDEYSGRALQ